MEVCSHTATHPQLLVRTRNTTFWEFLTSKIYFSVLTQRPVTTYADAYLSHDALIDGELGQAGFLSGRGGIGNSSITNFSRRMTLPSDWLTETGVTEFRRQLDQLYASAPEGTLQGFSGHTWEFTTEDRWHQILLLLQDYGERTDTWYATWDEVGSQIFLSHASRLSAPELGPNSVQYILQLDPLPRDVQAIPLTLRLVGTPEQLGKISAVTVDGVAATSRHFGR
jgi:hypothetical protein